MAEEFDAKELAANDGYGVEISSDFVTFGDVGEVSKEGIPCSQMVSGTLDSIATQNMENGAVGKYKITTEAGQEKTFLGGAILDDLLGSLELGTDLRLVFDGYAKAKAGKSAMKQYRLFIKE